MTIQPGAELLVTCDLPIMIIPPSKEASVVSAHEPTTFQARKNPLQISPSEALGPDIVQEWSSLPDKLKVLVLETHLVEKEQAIAWTFDTFVPAHKPCGFGRQSELLSHLFMTSEIARLAEEMFFSKNKIVIGNYGPYVMRMPPARSHHLVRRLQLWIDLRPQGLAMLRHFRSLGFSGLVEFQVVFVWGRCMVDPESPRHFDTRSSSTGTCVPGQGKHTSWTGPRNV